MAIGARPPAPLTGGRRRYYRPMAEPELVVEVDHDRADDGVVSVRLAGEIDVATAPLLAGELQTVLFTAAPKELVLDFSGVTFMDSAGLRVIIDVHNEIRRSDGLLVLEKISGAPAQLLEVTGLTGHLEMR